MYPAVECSRCECTIPEGEPYWSLSRSLEVIKKGVIKVQHAVSVATLCSDCAGERPSVDLFLRDSGGVAPDA